MRVRARIVVKKPGSRHDAVRALVRRGGGMLRALLAFVALNGGVTLYSSLAHAGTAHFDELVQTTDLRSRTAEASASSAVSGLHALDRPLVRQLEARELLDAEDDVCLDVLPVDPPLAHAPMLAIARPGPTAASLVWSAQFWASSALPRGPPFFARALTFRAPRHIRR